MVVVGGGEGGDAGARGTGGVVTGEQQLKYIFIFSV